MQKDSVAVPLDGPNGESDVELTIQLLPGDNPLAVPAPLVDKRNEDNPDLEPIQLLESNEYRYKITTSCSAIRIEPEELFRADDDSRKTGRLRAGLMTGVVVVSVFEGDRKIGTTRLEVRSRKLNYLSEYQWMLRDLADNFGELLLQAFAASEQRLELDASRSSESIYQGFAFLKNLLLSEEFGASIERIVRRPHSISQSIEEIRRPGGGFRGGAWLNRAVAKNGPRVPWPLNKNGVSLPARIAAVRSEETQDTNANRFIKFALSRWRAEVARVLDLLQSKGDSMATRRGKQEANTLLSYLDELLSRELFSDVGELRHLNGNDPVLLRREGYRDISRFFIQSHLAARLAWRGGESVYGAGKRDVATLYEYWAFVQLARLVAKISGQEKDLKNLITESEDGLNLKLQRGQESKISTTVRRLGRDMEVEFWFNRTFSPPRSSSWSFPMRPDFSIGIKPISDKLALRTGEVWLHFDAKYSGEEIAKTIGVGLQSESVPGEDTMNYMAARGDLLKMHTYRDAIRRSAGAYVLYPGNDGVLLPREYQELLPGLGAFCLRPSSAGEPSGLVEIERFLDDVLSHVASQMTQYERGRFWERESFSGQPPINNRPAAPFLERPPADTLVLLGFVKNERHHAWIIESGLYNLRADGRRGSVGLDGNEISANYILLYGPQLNTLELRQVTGAPLVMNDIRMRQLGYPTPGAEYICLPVGDRLKIDDILGEAEKLQDVVEKKFAPEKAPGQPIAISWLALCQELRRE